MSWNISDFINSTDTVKQGHTRIKKFLQANGERFPKKHGNWIRYKLGGGYFLEMDSWNQRINIKKGSGEPRSESVLDCCGFQGKTLGTFGDNFGAYHLPKSIHMEQYHLYMAYLTGGRGIA